MLASIRQDLGHGVVLLRRDPGVSGLIVLVLALGIGGNAAIFTLLKAAFLDPLPYRDANRLVTVIGSTGWNPNIWEFAELRARSRELGQWAFLEHRDMQLTGTEEPERVFGARVTASLFPLLGVNAALGRTFSAEENQAGRTPVVVLSNAFWRARMAADPAIIGRPLKLDGEPAVVVGVLPPGFHFDYPTLRVFEPVDIYVSFPLAESYRAGAGGLAGLVIARLRDGRTAAQAQGEMRSIGLTLVNENPSAFRDPDGKPTSLSFDVHPLRDAIVGTQQSLLWLLSGGVSVLLMIACANTAQLLIARGLRREREVAIRAALGASRPRLIRQFLMEGLVLSVCGGAAGLLLAGWIMRLLVNMLPVRSPVFESAQVDAGAMGFTLALSILSALIFSVVPAVKGSMSKLSPVLNVRTIGQRNRWRHGMLALEAALSVFLLCGAGLVAQNLWTLISTPAGFDASPQSGQMSRWMRVGFGSLTRIAGVPCRPGSSRAAPGFVPRRGRPLPARCLSGRRRRRSRWGRAVVGDARTRA